MTPTLTRHDLAERWRMTPRQAAAIICRVNPQFELRLNQRVYRYRLEDVEAVEHSSPPQEPRGLPENGGTSNPPAETEPVTVKAIPTPQLPCPQYRAADSGSGGVAHHCEGCGKTIKPEEYAGSSFHPRCNPLLVQRRREASCGG